MIIGFQKLEDCGYDQEIYYVAKKHILGTTGTDQGIKNRGVVFVSWGCHNKYLWLKTTGIYSLTVLEAEAQNQDVSRVFHSGGSKGELIL